MQVGYQVAAANFFYYAAIIFLLILISETLGMLCSGAFRAELTGAIVLQALYVPLLMFVGFFQVRAASFNTAHGSLLTLQSSAEGIEAPYSSFMSTLATASCCHIRDSEWVHVRCVCLGGHLVCVCFC